MNPMLSRSRALLWTAACLGLSHLSTNAAELQLIDPLPDEGRSAAVVVKSAPLVHTRQLFAAGIGDPVQQTALLLAEVRETLQAAGGDPNGIVKLNVYLASEPTREPVVQALAHAFRGKQPPAVSYIVSRLPHPSAVLAMDAVAVGQPVEQVTGSKDARTLPTGSRIYVSGQAERAESLAQATTATLESLRATLEHLQRTPRDIVQLKCFLSPMDEVEQAEQAIADFFQGGEVPPVVWVEWQAPLIEIELIAWGGPRKEAGGVEFSTPPGMTASPVYSRVATAHSERLIYVSGLYAREAATAEQEVADVFTQLKSILAQADSDLRHLVKATYYCSTNEASTKLNELRPKFYDPARPPAASKAMVTSTGVPRRGLTLDMIAVPTNRN